MSKEHRLLLDEINNDRMGVLVEFSMGVCLTDFYGVFL